MPISNIRNVGTGTVSQSTVQATLTVGIALTGAVAVGDLLLAGTLSWSLNAPATVTDAQGNTWHLLTSGGSGTNNGAFSLYYSFITHALNTGDTVTLHGTNTFALLGSLLAATGLDSGAAPTVGSAGPLSGTAISASAAKTASTDQSALLVFLWDGWLGGASSPSVSLTGVTAAGIAQTAIGTSWGLTCELGYQSTTNAVHSATGTPTGTTNMAAATALFAAADVAPAAPTLTTKSAFDVHQSTTFQWTFSDPDTSDTQASYELLITRHDTGATVYDSGKVAGTTTLANQVFTATLPANALTLASIQYDWTVKTWDNGGLVGPYAVVSSFTPFASPDAPTLSTTGSFNIAQAHTFGWQYNNTADAGNTQSAYQLQIWNNSGALVFDTGKHTSTLNTYTLPAGTLTAGGTYKWTVKTWDQHDNAGPYAAYQFFVAGGPPTATVTQPTVGEVVTQSALTAVWTYGGALPQAAYQLRLLVGGVQVYNSGQIVATANQAALPALSDATSYQLGVTVWDQTNVSGPETLVSFSTAFVQTPQPYLPSLFVDPAGGYISGVATAPAPSGAQVAADHFDIERSDDNGVTWVRIAADLSPM